MRSAPVRLLLCVCVFEERKNIKGKDRTGNAYTQETG